MDSQKEKPDNNSNLITKLGFKPANSKLHAFLRLLLCLLMIAAIALLVYQDIKDPSQFFTMRDIPKSIKPNSVLYNALLELDEQTRSVYIQRIRQASVSNQSRVIHRYTRSIAVALLSAVLSEYIISGNLNKPVSVIAKTIIFTTINITVS